MMMEGEGRGSIGSINLSKDKKLVVWLSGQVHHLPCCIKYDGPCSVSDYFSPKPNGMEVDGLRVEEAYFRGRKLRGTTVPLPHGYSGFILGKESRGKRKVPEMSKESSNCWEVNAKFDKLSYWNHDTLPSKDDTFLRAFHWFAVAEALHKPVTDGDLVSASVSLKEY
ncbi:hypothetical protein Ddye_005256 [Dipteronia dyeriana]|uniref:Uncharacterized protein n=1 Tax=Dipteronia dyeriana TaxID=168575 RepID=A0AAE0CQ29_9ROSI|nr:hypothetical protein Ddye_005256 [Dipteronia dyeriana]